MHDLHQQKFAHVMFVQEFVRWSVHMQKTAHPNGRLLLCSNSAHLYNVMNLIPNCLTEWKQDYRICV
jgi:hypothetical protein